MADGALCARRGRCACSPGLARAVNDGAAASPPLWSRCASTARLLRGLDQRSRRSTRSAARTSTFDGLAIAWLWLSICTTSTRAKVLFATHFHELTDLAHCHAEILHVQALARKVGQFMKMRREQHLGARACRADAQPQPTRSPARRKCWCRGRPRRGAAGSLVAAVRMPRGLAHLDHESRFAAPQIVARADPGEARGRPARASPRSPARSCPSAP